jgi:putative DNA primase/helicase
MSWIQVFRAVELNDPLGTFDGLANIGLLPLAVGADVHGKVKDPSINGAAWGRTPIAARREILVKQLTANPATTGLGCQPIGHLVIDIDPPGKDRDKLEECQAELEAVLFGDTMPATLTIGTQAGRHFWFKATPDLIDWWGDSGKKEIKLSNGAKAELFLGIASKQTMVAVPPSLGKEIEVEMEPAEIPAHVVAALKRIINPPKSSDVPRAAVNVPMQSHEENWFVQRAEKIINTIAQAQENSRHATFRGGMVAMAGYAAGVGCFHLRDWFLDAAKRAHKYAKPEVSDRVLELTANWAWSRGGEWPMVPGWIEKKRSGNTYDPFAIEPDIQIEDVPQVVPEPAELPDLAAFDNPHKLARQWIDEQGMARVIFWQGDFWQWSLGKYDTIPAKEIDARLSLWLDKRFADHAAEEFARIEDPKMRAAIKIKGVTGKIVSDVREAVASLTTKELKNIEAMPSWLVPHAWDAREVIAMQNAIVNPRLIAVENLTSNLFTRYRTDYDWCDNPPEPKRFLAFLKSIWPHEPDCIRELQKFFGYVLTQDTRQQKILLLIGPPRSGKGTIARILRALLGAANVASPSLGDLATPFGLAQCIGRPLAIIPDARIGNRNDQSIIVERLLSISGEDQVSIDRKYKEAFLGRLPTRLVICSNELPQLQDTTGALPNRYLILPMTKSHLGSEDRDLEADILKELPGIVWWAVMGFKLLTEEGRFNQTRSGAERLKVLQELCSPIVAFINERYDITGIESDMIPADDMQREWISWCSDTGHHAGSTHKFSKNLTDAYPVCGKKRLRATGSRIYVWTGIKAKTDE